MRFKGAVIKEQGVTFAIVVVKKHIIDNESEAKSTVRIFQQIFSGIPVVLMAQDSRGAPRYYGRRDLVKFMANVPLRAIPWREYTVNL